MNSIDKNVIKKQLEIYSTVSQGLRELEEHKKQIHNKYQDNKEKVLSDLVATFDTESDSMYSMKIYISSRMNTISHAQFFRVTRNMIHTASVSFSGSEEAPKSNEDILLILNNLDYIDVSDFHLRTSFNFYDNMLTPLNGSYRLKWLEESICELEPDNFLVSVSQEVYETVVSLIAHLSLNQEFEKVRSHAKQMRLSDCEVAEATLVGFIEEDRYKFKDPIIDSIKSYWNIDSEEKASIHAKKIIKHKLEDLKRFPLLYRNHCFHN